jgi:PHD/YefM family antitoxin component YafN of YafNO toxin-antitoxin module
MSDWLPALPRAARFDFVQKSALSAGASYHQATTPWRELDVLRKLRKWCFYGDFLMITVPASDFAKNFGHYREMVQAESVAVTSHNRVTGYFISRKEFDEFERLKARATKSYEVQDLPTEAIQALSSSAMDSSHDALNAMLRD